MGRMTGALLVGGLGLGLGLVLGLGGCDGVDASNALIASKKTAEHMQAKFQMKGFADLIVADELSSGEWPLSLDAMADEGSIPVSYLEDPWGNDYWYSPPDIAGEKPVLYSFGPDGESGTVDDVHHEWQ